MFYRGRTRAAALRAALAALFLLCLPAAFAPGRPALSAPQQTGSIAYVDSLGWDQIRLVRPDGSGDRLLWAHGLDDPYDENGYDPGAYNVLTLAWKPGGGELAFAATHEQFCSLNSSDLYSLAANGAGYRRITQAPACAALAGYPTGTVTIPVENPYASQFEAQIYFQGAAAAQQLSVAPNSSATVTFRNVADLGAGVMQRAILLNAGDSEEREFGEETAIDVQAGATVRTAELQLDFPNTSWRKSLSPTWRSDGSKLGYSFSYYAINQIAPRPAVLQQGSLLVSGGSFVPDMLNYADLVRWGPAGSRAAQLLFVSEDTFTNRGIYLATEGDTDGGTRLITLGSIREEVLDIAWLPDGAGFLYALQEPAPELSGVALKANLYSYSFATGRATRVTNMAGETYIGRFSLSPDGSQIVFERTEERGVSFPTGELRDPELWIMDRDGSDMRLLVEHGRAPAWGPNEIGQPAPTPTATRPGPTPTRPAGTATPRPPAAHEVFLPAVQRGDE